MHTYLHPHLQRLLMSLPTKKTMFQVNDITTLKLREAYIACTADLVLKSKGVQLFDVFVTGKYSSQARLRIFQRML